MLEHIDVIVALSERISHGGSSDISRINAFTCPRTVRLRQ